MLVAALIAVMILMALGIFALTTSSQDVKATARSVSEGNALSAAEAGVQTLCANFSSNPYNHYTTKTVIQDSTGSTNASFIVQQTQLTCCRTLQFLHVELGRATGYIRCTMRRLPAMIICGVAQVPLNIGIMNASPVPATPTS